MGNMLHARVGKAPRHRAQSPTPKCPHQKIRRQPNHVVPRQPRHAMLLHANDIHKWETCCMRGLARRPGTGHKAPRPSATPRHPRQQHHIVHKARHDVPLELRFFLKNITPSESHICHRTMPHDIQNWATCCMRGGGWRPAMRPWVMGRQGTPPYSRQTDQIHSNPSVDTFFLQT